MSGAVAEIATAAHTITSASTSVARVLFAPTWLHPSRENRRDLDVDQEPSAAPL
jgi:hypothetical protein